MTEEFEKFNALFERAKNDKGLLAYLARAIEGAQADTKDLDGIADRLYDIGRQGGKTVEEIKTEYKGFAAGMAINRTIHAKDMQQAG